MENITQKPTSVNPTPKWSVKPKHRQAFNAQIGRSVAAAQAKRAKLAKDAEPTEIDDNIYEVLPTVFRDGIGYIQTITHKGTCALRRSNICTCGARS